MKKLVLLFLLTGWSLLAQEVKISGTVTGEDNQPLSGAVITLKEINLRHTTGSNGEFEFTVKPRKYTLVISYTGYQTKEIVVIAQRYTYLKIQLHPAAEKLEEVIINAVKATPDMPVAQTNVTKEQLQEQNLGQDIPYLLETLPGVVVTSDAGAGVGYTGIRIRGISPQQINVTLNGIPFNDPESQSVYWVDIPDIAANTQSIQIQRGVGTSTFGTGAFGASINLQTDRISKEASAGIQAAYGSFNTQKFGIKGSTGLLNNHFSFTGHFSKTTSDGYIDRASSNLKSYYVSGAYKDGKNTLKALAFGGHEITYQAWYGVDKQTFKTNPTFNYAGAIYDNNWNVIDYYDNEVDNYRQDHYQLHFSHKFTKDFMLNLATHYTYGRGYYEQYKQDEDFADYGFAPVVINGQTIDHTDLIRRKWLDNDFYGAVASLEYHSGTGHYILGLAANEYDGRHFGRVIWTQYASDNKIRHEYYRNTGIKKSVNGFTKAVYNISKRLKLFTDIQFRKIDYTVNGTITWQTPWQLTDHLFFINPKIGLYYDLDSPNDLYLSVAQTHREPNRDDYQNSVTGKPKPETLNDIEAGWKYKNNKLITEVNLYAMLYKDQLVLSGRITNVGDPIRENVGESHRYGIETRINYSYNDKINFEGNLSLSDNRNKEYIARENGQFKVYKKTKIAYSPDVVGAGMITFKPVKKLKLTAITKYVGSQYMDNRNIPASKLDSYWIENLLLSYKTGSAKWFKNATFTLKLNNIFNNKYASNGYMWGDDPYYFPQAGFNVLAGFNLEF